MVASFSEKQNISSTVSLGLKYMQEIEMHALLLRKQANLAAFERLNPKLLEFEFNMIIQGSEALTEEMKGLPVKRWSGGGLIDPETKTLSVFLNPHQTNERANVTIMEEVSHIHYGHEPSEIYYDLDHLDARSFNSSNERQAYFTAAAALLPAITISTAVWGQQSVEMIAARYGTSTQLVEMRIKLLNLWPDHLRNLNNNQEK